MQFRKWIQESDDGDNLFGKDRIPLSARMKRTIQLSGPKDDGTIGKLDQYATWSPTHRSKDIPDLEIMVTKDDGKVVHFITSYGGKGSEPKHLFNQRWIAIPNQDLN